MCRSSIEFVSGGPNQDASKQVRPYSLPRESKGERERWSHFHGLASSGAGNFVNGSIAVGRRHRFRFGGRKGEKKLNGISHALHNVQFPALMTPPLSLLIVLVPPTPLFPLSYQKNPFELMKKEPQEFYEVG